MLAFEILQLNLSPSALSSIDIPIINGDTSDKTGLDSAPAGSDESKSSQVRGSDDGLKKVFMQFAIAFFF